MTMLTLGERLRKLREEKNLKQHDVAISAGLRENQLSRWERDRQKPKLENLKILAKFYGVSLDDLTQ